MAARQIIYIDFGYETALEFWNDIVLVGYQEFVADASRRTAIIACVQLWHFDEWMWHEHHPGVDTRGEDYEEFKRALFSCCPALAWIRDIADGSKHRGLRRAQDVKAVGPTPKGLVASDGVVLADSSGSRLVTSAIGLDITMTDDEVFPVSDILKTVYEFWTQRLTLEAS